MVVIRYHFGGGKAPVEITRRTDYAIRMLLELAKSGGGPKSVRSLAASQEVPYAFARGIQRDLTAAGIVEARRGAAGGAVLVKAPENVSLLEVVRATQSTACAACTDDPEWCDRAGGCAVHRVWQEADEMVSKYLGSKSLAGLINMERGR
jgi:Rrf2 family protein